MPKEVRARETSRSKGGSERNLGLKKKAEEKRTDWTGARVLTGGCGSHPLKKKNCSGGGGENGLFIGVTESAEVQKKARRLTR